MEYFLIIIMWLYIGLKNMNKGRVANHKFDNLNFYICVLITN